MLADAKLVVMYRRPKDVDAFEKIYQAERVPLAIARLGGKSKIVATKILCSPQGTSPFCRIAEVYFPSMQALEACASSAELYDPFLRLLAVELIGSEQGTTTFLLHPAADSDDIDCEIRMN